jgi:hypothetical protein
MELNAVTQGTEMISQGREVLGVAVIGIAFLYSTVRALLHIKQRNRDSYQS